MLQAQVSDTPRVALAVQQISRAPGDVPFVPEMCRNSETWKESSDHGDAALTEWQALRLNRR